MSDYRSVPEETESLPRGIKYIIGNEAAERFSYYGMRTILVVFMTKYLHYMIAGSRSPDVMSEAKAQEYYHLFVSATYFFPVLGSFLSDVLVGKYRTILWLSIVWRACWNSRRHAWKRPRRTCLVCHRVHEMLPIV